MQRRFTYTFESRLRADQDYAQGRPATFDARCRPLKHIVAMPSVKLCRERPASLNGSRPLPLATAERFPSQEEWIERGGAEEEKAASVWTLSG